MPMKLLFVILATIALSMAEAYGQIKFETVEYRQGDAVLQGLLVYDASVDGQRPAMLVAHQWKGLTDYEKRRAEMLAKLGYCVLAADIYGQGVRPTTREAASAEAGKYKADRPLLKARIVAALEFLRSRPYTNPNKIAAIGYCFGGTTVLELARSGAAVAGVVSFHGGLATPTPAEAKNIRAKVLALHGADDPFVPRSEVEGFETEMRGGHVDWQLVEYGGAVHSFTDANAGADPSTGSAYNEAADRRSWEAMKLFLAEVFR